jgi:hypothetical protein
LRRPRASAGSGDSGAGSGGGEHVKARRRRDCASAMAWMGGLTPLMARGAWQMDEIYIEVVFTASIVPAVACFGWVLGCLVWVVRVRWMDAAAAPATGMGGARRRGAFAAVMAEMARSWLCWSLSSTCRCPLPLCICRLLPAYMQQHAWRCKCSLLIGR